MDCVRGGGSNGGGGSGNGSLNCRWSWQLSLWVQGLHSIKLMLTSVESVELSSRVYKKTVKVKQSYHHYQQTKKGKPPLKHLAPPATQAPNPLPEVAVWAPKNQSQDDAFWGLSRAVLPCPGHWLGTFWMTDMCTCASWKCQLQERLATNTIQMVVTSHT